MSQPPLPALPHRVLIAGGGVAGLEALLALRTSAGDLVSTTLVAPDTDFLVRALSVQEPFARPAPRRYDLPSICGDQGAGFVHDAVHAVHSESRTVTTAGGEEIEYDSLLIAIGARPSAAFGDALTFRGDRDAERFHGLVQDVEGGYVTSVAFVVPTGVTWSLPLYELALMTAERADGMGVDVKVTIVTPESEPLAIFGREASLHVGELLAAARIGIHTDCHVTSIERGLVSAAPGGVEVRAQRVVALPLLNAPRVVGLPADAEGFLPVDEHGLVRGTADIFGAGDGTTNPIKQGGIAAQQAGAAAMSIAARAGASVEPQPFRPVMRAELLTGSRPVWLGHRVAGGAGDQASAASEKPMWWPPTKVAAPRLAKYLEQIDSGLHRSSASGVIMHAEARRAVEAVR